AKVEGVVIKALVRLFAWVPLNVLHRIAAAFAWCAYRLPNGSRSVIEANLCAAFPDRTVHERAAIAERCFRHTLLLAAETGVLWHGSRRQWTGLINPTDGYRRLDEWLRGNEGGGPGRLILVPHYGNWELLALILGGYDLTALYDPPRLMSLEGPIRTARERSGATLVPIDARGIRALLRALRSGQPVAVLPDQVPQPNAGVYAPFFGRPTLTMTLVHRLITRGPRPPETALVATRRRGSRFDVMFEPLDGEQLAQSDAETCMTTINQAIERLVEVEPSQYQWNYKRFKRPPEGWEKLY
ncbi:MAG: lysophospholipid acyltransferase family protein, partial [Pseudomonadota bacterium]